MRILLTNDDGLRAPGIRALYEAIVDWRGEFGRSLGGAKREDIMVVAPTTVQSATSHGVTFHTPLMIDQERLGWAGDAGMTGIAVDGRPADCTKLALTALWPERHGAGARPDLVISGMNMGANVGINVIYSGTVAAAIEAAFLGVPAIAVSLHMGRGEARYDVAARYARRTLDVILAGGLPRPHECLSINIPITEREWERQGLGEGGWPPIRVCPMNTHGLNDRYERRVSPGGDVYYWSAGGGLDFRETGEGTDVEWLWKRAITVTPLSFDLTRHEGLREWRQRLEGGGG
jgi:5'-nucleotidase